MRLLRWTATALLAATLAATALAQATNPILPHADPFITWDPVTRTGGYVLTATAREITLWSGSTPAGAASNPHVIFTPKPEMTQLWSPTVWKIDDRWWVYFTAQVTGERHKIYVLQSDTDDILGTYTFKGPLETGRETIDPSLLTVGASRYLMYVTVDSGANQIWIRKLGSGMAFQGPPALIGDPKAGWEKGEGSTKNYPVNEGPTALYHDGRTFVVFSASDTASPRYCLGLLTLTGSDPMQPANWKKTPHPVFEWAPQNGIYGPGRGTFARDQQGRFWLLYAARITDAPTSAGRATRAQRFTWNPDGSPNFGAPLQDGPIQP